jgi:26S proteasome regulatory subunit T5
MKEKIHGNQRQTVFLLLIGLVPPEKLKPGDLVGVNKDSYLVLDTLPLTCQGDGGR